MKKLYLTHAESRRLHGTDTFNPPSRFLREIPKDLIDEIRPRAQTNIPYNRKDFEEIKNEFEEEIGISLGQKVQHNKFVEGDIWINYVASENHNSGKKEETDLGFQIRIYFESFN